MANSQTKTLADLVVAAIAAWSPTSPPWPTFTPAFRWVPVHKLETLTDLVVNVAPASMTGTPLARKYLDRERDIAIQVAQKLVATESAAATQIDNLLALVEQLDDYLFKTESLRVLGAKFSLLKTTVHTFDWDLVYTKRCFHAVSALTFKSQE